MKLLRVGNKNEEKPAIIDNNGIIRDLSSIIDDFTPNTINETIIEKIKKAKINELPKSYGGLGISILSTPKGVMSDTSARSQNVGGEVLCQVF